jgi:hypothetical protein
MSNRYQSFSISTSVAVTATVAMVTMTGVIWANSTRDNDFYDSIECDIDSDHDCDDSGEQQQQQQQ